MSAAFDELLVALTKARSQARAHQLTELAEILGIAQRRLLQPQPEDFRAKTLTEWLGERSLKEELTT